MKDWLQTFLMIIGLELFVLSITAKGGGLLNFILGVVGAIMLLAGLDWRYRKNDSV